MILPYSLSLAELDAMPTISQGYTDDLKIATDTMRVWIARTTVEDGEPCDNRVHVERLIDGCWIVTETYQAI